jgi:PAS domain S-box-containing protein
MTNTLAISSQLDADVNEHFAAIVDSSFDAIISKDLNSIIRSWNGAAERLFGYTPAEAIGQSVLMLIPDHLKSEEADIISRLRSGERIDSFETTRRRKDGELISVSLTISPVRNKAGQIVGASKIARDITAAKETERRIRMLMREVNHRTKNQFAVILSMIGETKRRAASPQEFEERVRERIMALSRSHDLLVTAEWAGATLFSLIQEHLKPFGHDDQITLSGPMVMIHPNAVQPLGMAFHELATNSSKYGALSNDQGRLSVNWRTMHPIGEEPQFELEWHEETAGRLTNAERKGFGSIVLQRIAPAALNGRASLERANGVVVWRIAAAASGVLNDH